MVSVAQFSGPIEKLLQLVEEQKLAITEVSLAEVTDRFLSYVENHDIPAPVLADFLVVASRLVLIKSKVLLPSLPLTEEEEKEIQELELRLHLYKTLRPFFKILRTHWRSKRTLYARQYLGNTRKLLAGKMFYPGRNLSAQAITHSAEKLLQGMLEMRYETVTVKERIVTVEEKITEIVERLQRVSTTRFRELAASSASKSEIIAIFLALLHLMRDRAVLLEQSEAFSDIIVIKQ